MNPHLEHMFRFVSWADGHTLSALHEAPKLAQTEALPLQAHLLAAEDVWLARLGAGDFVVRDLDGNRLSFGAPTK